MARAYSEDLRLRVVQDVETGASRRAVAARYRVSVSFGVKLVSRWRAAGTLKPRRVGGAKLHALAPHLELVRRLLAEVPDLTLRSRNCAGGWPSRACASAARRSTAPWPRRS